MRQERKVVILLIIHSFLVVPLLAQSDPVMEWPLNREYNTVANTRRIWYFSNSLQGTHGAEDWYATPASPDGACGASIKSVYGGLVTFSGSAAGGQVVIIEHEKQVRL